MKKILYFLSEGLSGDLQKHPYTFQLRDATTGTILGSQSYTTAASMPRFQNITLVLKGMAGGTGTAALGLQLVKNF